MAYTVLVLALCLNCALTLTAQGDQIHNRLSDKEIYRIFHSSRSEVPDYKTILLKSVIGGRSRREVRRVVYEVDGTTVVLNLSPFNDILMSSTSLWTVETDNQSPANHRYHMLSNKKDLRWEKIFYADLDKMALFLAWNKDDDIQYDGIIGESQKTKIVRSFLESTGAIESEQSEEDVQSNTHLIFDVNLNKNTTDVVGDIIYADKLDKPLDTLYPKLLIVLTSDYFRKKFGEDIEETIEYIATFWNAVNLKYRKLTNLKVEIMITGIIIAKDDTALRYVYDSRNRYDMDTVNLGNLLDKQSNYFQQTFRNKVNLTNYDAIITITSLNTGRAAGRAFIGAICQDYNNVGVINDDGRFSGLHAATHELGHLLNMTHDGIGDAKSCQINPEPNVGSIMSYKVEHVEKLVWSSCSIDSIQNFAATKAAECLKNIYRY